MIRRRRAPGRPGAGIPFHRLTVTALVVAAMGPVALLGLLVYDQVDRSLVADAEARTERAVQAASAQVDARAHELDVLVSSYANWQAFADQVAAGRLEPVRTNVLGFLLERQDVAGGVVRTDDATVAAGPPALVDALLDPGAAAGPRVLSRGGEVYLASGRPILADDGRRLGWIVLATKLDARVAADIAALTGFDVAIVAADGTVAVTTDVELTDVPFGGGDGPVRTGDVIRRVGPLDGAGSPERLVITTRVSALQAAAGTLPVLVLALLGVTALLAVAFAILLSAILRRRLGVVRDGLVAVADGRVPPGAAPRNGDDFDRLSDALDGLVLTLDRRETTLRRCLEAAASIPVDTSPREAGARLARATVEAFGVTWCRIVGADGRVLGAAVAGGDPADPGTPGGGRVIETALGLGTDGRRLEVALGGEPWTDGDQAGLDVMALLTGAVLDEVEAYSRAAGRADRLDRLNRLQREFLRSVSHNLRAPLATIELAAADLEELAPSAFVQQRAEAIRIEERRLARLVDQLLILSRLESGTLDLEGEPVAIAAVVREVVADMKIADRVHIHQARGAGIAFVDRAATEQIAWILLDNARRYAPDGRIRVSVEPGPRGPEPTLRLVVEDDGPGVARDERQRIFHRFARGRAAAGTEGTGLGLSVARGLARSQGGDIVCADSSTGARFEVRLPAAVAAPDADERAAPPAAPADPPARTRRGERGPRPVAQPDAPGA